MDGKTRYVVGFDLNDKITQISYFEISKDEPETLVSGGDNDRFGIPTVLCKRKGVNQWSIGNESGKVIENDDETEVSQLLAYAIEDKKFVADGEEFESIDLLMLFVLKAMTLLSVHVSTEQIDGLVFTVSSLDVKMLNVLERIAVALPIDREKISFQSYAESIYHYMLHQEKELFENEIVVFDNSGNDINCFYMHMNHYTTPVVTMIEEYYFENVECPTEETTEEARGELDEKLLALVHDFLMSKSVRTSYLLGDGFDGEWCKRTINFLCMGRRVFQGKNMYSKGACFYGKDKIYPPEIDSHYVFLGKDKLQFNLGMHVDKKGVEEYIAIADGGENWFEAGKTLEFLLIEGNKIKFIVTPLDGKEAREVSVLLEGIQVRPAKTTRLLMKVTFVSGSKVVVRIKDMGFGEIFKASSLSWEKEIEIF